MSYHDYFWEKAKKDVHSTENFQEFLKLHPLFKQFGEYQGTTWLERDYDAVKARPDCDIYCARTLLLPKALKSSDIFASVKLMECPRNNQPSPSGYVSTSRIDEKLGLKDSWQGQKFYGYYAEPTEEARKAFQEHTGTLYGFEVVQRGEEFLIIGRASESSIFRTWLAIVYDLDAITSIHKKELK